jgi:L-lysine epsilon oxidase C-terminal domain/L-Lysine epsilon oxidase N-terminal
MEKLNNFLIECKKILVLTLHCVQFSNGGFFMRLHQNRLCLGFILSTSLSLQCYGMNSAIEVLEKGAMRFVGLHKNSNYFFSNYKIHPSIGIARAGNCDEVKDYYLAPQKIGGLPLEKDGSLVKKFKNSKGQIRRQAAHFQIYKDGVVVPKSEIETIVWYTHLANKKAAWWEFNEFCGDLMISNNNSYEYWSKQTEKFPSEDGKRVEDRPVVSKRNKNEQNRRSLIVDYGPRAVTFGKNPTVPEKSFAHFNKEHDPYSETYKKTLPPEKVKFGVPVNTLGMLEIGDDASLHVIGGFGHAGGDTQLAGFGGGDRWHDDVSDGPVEAYVKFKNGEKAFLGAWVVVGSPKYAPELVNITTWSDTVLDMAVRYHNVAPHLFRNGKFVLGKDGFYPFFERDIRPLFERMKNYNWVANVTPMVFFANPPFDIKDNSNENLENRRNWFRYLRQTCDLTKEVKESMVLDASRQVLFDNGYPLMPLNSGDNSVRNQNVSKFVTLSPLQYYMLYQWSEGFFDHDLGSKNSEFPKFNELDQASIGNCVGYPMSPGIEVTWSIRNPIIYKEDDPYRIKHRRTISQYFANHLDPDRDEADPKNKDSGCEPGDLTKRMAIPWQADFVNCTVQSVNYTDPKNNKEIVKNGDKYVLQPILPSYNSYWWPAQSPYNVYTSYTSKDEQVKDMYTAGEKVKFQRGIEDDPKDPYVKMVDNWYSLGFILNNNNDPKLREKYPSFVEKFRNFDDFEAKSVAEVLKDKKSETLLKSSLYSSPSHKGGEEGAISGSTVISTSGDIIEKDKSYPHGIVHTVKKN